MGLQLYHILRDVCLKASFEEGERERDWMQFSSQSSTSIKMLFTMQLSKRVNLIKMDNEDIYGLIN